MTFRVRSIDCYRVNMQTRFPFRYGIACMTEVPHLILRLDAEVNGSPCQGVAADGLPPKWFTKNPGTSFEADDLPEMLRSIRNAADVASSVPRQDSLFD